MVRMPKFEFQPSGLKDKLFSTGNDTSIAYSFVYFGESDDRTILHNPKTGETITFLTTSQETNGELFRMGYTMAPHAAIADEHSHPYQEMIIRVQSGTNLSYRRCRAEDRGW